MVLMRRELGDVLREERRAQKRSLRDVSASAAVSLGYLSEIVQLIGYQQTTKDIAKTLFISEKTVEHHRSNIMKKLALPAEKNALLVWAVKNMPTNGMGSGKG